MHLELLLGNMPSTYIGNNKITQKNRESHERINTEHLEKVRVDKCWLLSALQLSYPWFSNQEESVV